MQNFMERTNIAHFAERLKTETDSVKRALLIKLLAEEEAKQAMLRTVNRHHLRPILDVGQIVSPRLTSFSTWWLFFIDAGDGHECPRISRMTPSSDEN